MTADAAREILDFWFGAPGTPEHGQTRPEWFRKDAAFDARIAARFAALIEKALAGGLRSWATAGAPSALARILLLDQFTRNAFRGTARSFAGDALALQAAQAMVAAAADLQLPAVQRWFVYLPFEYAENIAMQDESLRLFGALARADASFASVMDYAHRHRDIILRFGRFPHRNDILGRESTAEEIAFLEEPGSSF
jgi:uncharacterized protein (DUF924 family)